ncbi:MAG: ABC transporter permease [Balneolaceae bacterium]|nr:ABC transporter permease [Balneolaceae bacterium]MBO6544846.1 ABC transporter permease [Balneolaceae bacterium]MBO6646242.1 ABC transporter permease [Balneolaceae bacterium]
MLDKIFKKLRPFLFPLILILLWEISSFLVGNYSNRYNFISPTKEIIEAIYHLFSSTVILPYLFDTLWRTIFSFSISGVFGLLLGMYLGLQKRAEIIFYSTFDAIRSIPPIALLPFLILLFGIDDNLKIVFISFGAIWPIYINTYTAVKNIEPIYLKVADNLNLSSTIRLRKVIFPSILPGFFSGLKISLSLALILSIVVEMLTGNTGLGWYLNYSKRNFNYAEMYSMIIIIGLLGWIINYLFKKIERKIIFWNYES